LWIRVRIGSGLSDFMDPDPYWESGSRGKKVKKFQWKMHFLVIFFLNLPIKRYKIALTTFWKKNLMNNTGIFYLILLKFWFQKNLRKNCLRKFCFSLAPDPELDPDPDWAKMLDPDPYWINPDPQPCFPV
jgi:hypothetical protein